MGVCEKLTKSRFASFLFQAAWFDLQSGDGGMKCVLGDSEGTLSVSARRRKLFTVTVKVRGPNPMGLRGLLWDCVQSAVKGFPGIKMTEEALICSCKRKTYIDNLKLNPKVYLERSLKCSECHRKLPIDDLVPIMTLASLHVDNPDEELKLLSLSELMKAPEQAKKENKFPPELQVTWRHFFLVYLRRIFLPGMAAIRTEESPPLLWLPRTSSDGYG